MRNLLHQLLKTATRRYAVAGAAFGCLFPIVATLISVLVAKLALGVDSLLDVQRTQPLLWIIDTAPFFLGLFASFAGRREDSLRRLNADLHQLNAHIETLHQTAASELAVRTSQLLTSRQVSRVVTSTLDLDQLFRSVVDLITERFGCHYAAVFTVDDTRQWAILRQAAGAAGITLMERGHKLEITGQSMVGAAIRMRQPRIAHDTSVEMVRFANPLLPDTRSEIALPLVAGDRVLGALDVQSTQIAAFDETYAAMLQTMADQIASVFNRAKLFQQTEETLTNARNLFAASQAMSTATDTDSILRALIDYVAPDASRAGITLNGPRDEIGQPTYFEFSATWVHADFATLTQLIRPGSRFTPQQMPVISSVTLTQPLVVPDASADEVLPGLRTFMHRFGAEALTALALVAGQNPLGILIVGYRQARTFSADFIQTLVTLSGQVANVIQNRRSLAETQAALAQLDQLNRRLTGEAWQAYTAPLGGSLKIRDVALDAPSAQSASTPAVLDAPIVVRGEPIGTLKLQDVDPHRIWSANDRTLLEAVANEIAVAIDNARLLEQTEHRARRDRAIAETADKIHQPTDLDAILRVAVDELSRITGISGVGVQFGFAPAVTSGSNGHPADHLQENE
jgi:GAF domain-containing protein